MVRRGRSRPRVAESAHWRSSRNRTSGRSRRALSATSAQAGLRLHSREAAYSILVGRPCEGNHPEGEAPRNYVAPGQPDRSILLHRMTLTGLGRMPHIGSRAVHDSAVKLIREWIAGLPPEPAP